MDNNRWVIERAGLVNFWYYDEEEFNFCDGRLLLRGSNGSGKSVTMQSFIPLLLDGNKSPERLDPFGTKARKLENYLLGEADDGEEERTGYLFMEFRKKSSGNFLTIGMGFKAVRGKPLQSWGFSITDGRRIGHDFFLYKDMGDRIPLTRKELENRIGNGGHVLEGQGDYMNMVNNLLFGFDDIEEYDELVKLLIQLRSPKLSKDFKPTAIYEIMENSLQQLSEDDLRPMSEAIENMDNIKNRLEELKESKKAADKIKTAYDRYNRFTLFEKARYFVLSSNELDGILKKRKVLEDDKNRARIEYEEASRNIDELKMQQRVAGDKKKELENNDSLKIKEKINGLLDDINNTQDEVNNKNAQLDVKKSKERKLNFEICALKGREYKETGEIEKELEEMDILSDDFAFDEQGFMRDEVLKNIKSKYDFSYIKERLKLHVKALETGKEIITQYNNKSAEYDNISLELERAKQDRAFKDKKLNEAEVLLLETKEELIENIHSWNRENAELRLSDECLVMLSRAVNGYSSSVSYGEITGIVRQEYNFIESAINSERTRKEVERDNLACRYREIENEINQWKNKKDPEPEREEKVILSRKRLAERGIPFVPLYRAVDFKSSVPEDVRGNIEEALIDMGLLDALIIPLKYKKEVLDIDSSMGDKYIFPSPKYLMHDLTELLQIEKINIEGLSYEDIDNALRSILIDENSNSTFFNEKGEYGIGILRGRTSRVYTPKFIGAEARKRYREEMILKLSESLDEFQLQIDSIDNEISMLSKRLGKLNNEFNAFPDGVDLTAAADEVKNAEFNLEKAVEEEKKRESEERKVYSELKSLQQKVYDTTHKINLKADIEVYSGALRASTDYRDMLYDLEARHGRLIQMIENIKRFEDDLEDIRLDIENIISDITVKERRLKESKALVFSLEEQLKLTNYEEIRSEIEHCLKLLEELPKKIEQEIKKSVENKNIYEAKCSDIIRVDEEIKIKQTLLDINKSAFIEEYKLGYVEKPSNNFDAFKAASIIMREVRVDEKQQKDDLVSNLFAKISENGQYLREYILKSDWIFEKDINDEDEELKNALLRCKRHNITAKVRGKDVDFYSLLDFINEGIEENEGLLRESDRQLFEDILVKNISKKIRAKIYHSEQWVKKMNELMESMDTSSGLSFSLKWSSRKAEVEGQLDTRELVELLKQEGALMKDSDLNRLSEHFRSKISEARRILEDTGKSQSFHSIMREILDYRKWFEFRLYYTKTGQNKKELTNNAFYQLSGGEKAMAMYVPLFSAVFARYQGARADCPRIISLDEAFAGVDEKNIRDMFRLLGNLNLDFIINSQVLWGDYDTVPSLSICELIRPDNAKFVTVIRYIWNGNVKELVV